MKSPAKSLYFLYLFTILATVSCVPEDDLGPDTGDPRDKFIGSWLFTKRRLPEILMQLLPLPFRAMPAILHRYCFGILQVPGACLVLMA